MNTPIKLTLNLSQIAELAKVSLSAVSQWRKRYDDFPKSLGESSLGASFSYEEVRDWLIRNDKLVDEASPEKILYFPCFLTFSSNYFFPRKCFSSMWQLYFLFEGGFVKGSKFLKCFVRTSLDRTWF